MGNVSRNGSSTVQNTEFFFFFVDWLSYLKATSKVLAILRPFPGQQEKKNKDNVYEKFESDGPEDSVDSFTTT